MKIAIIDNKLNLETGGGSNNHLHLIASELVKLGYDVSVITLDLSRTSCPDDLPYPVINEGLNKSRFDRNYRLVLQKALRKYEGKFDIYHIWNPNLLLGGAFYRWCGGKVPVVVNLIGFHFCPAANRMDINCCMHCGFWQRIMHRNESPAKKVLMAPFYALSCALEFLLLNHVDATLPVTQDMAKVYSRHHLDVGKMTVIPVPIPYEYLSGLRRNQRSEASGGEAYNILYAGRLRPSKGVDILIKAIPKLDFNVRLHIAGDGVQRSELELLVKNLGISDRVIFHGWVNHEDVADLYLSSQLFVHPARWPEVFCLSVVEAMALGVPVVVSDYGNIAPQLGGAALPFKRTDVEDLVEKIKLVHSDPSLANSLVEKAQEKAKEFDYRGVISRLTEVYRTTLEGAK